MYDKSAVITGAGSGIGRAIAEKFASQGALVHILELNEANASETVTTIKALKGEALVYTADVSIQSQVKAVIEQIKQVDILVNCAGIAHVGKAHETSEEDFDRVYNVNVKGTYNCLYDFYFRFKKENRSSM